jgi:hypothetical protein
MYRLRLPKKAMHVVEQIVICKLMLFNYMYHHSKVRAAEGMLERMLGELVTQWQKGKRMADEEIVERFLLMTDSSIADPIHARSPRGSVGEYCSRIRKRLLPREIFALSGNVTHAGGELVQTFLNELADKTAREGKVSELEEAIGAELLRLNPSFARTGREALAKAGIWVDVAKRPKFEDLRDLVIDAGDGGENVPVSQLFPIGEWQQAWTTYRYYVRVYSFSENLEVAQTAARYGMAQVLGIEDKSFFDAMSRKRA